MTGPQSPTLLSEYTQTNSSIPSRRAFHDEQRTRSEQLLHAARDAARRAYGFGSQEACEKMATECATRSNDTLQPFPWQLDIAECLLLGLDCELIAPTGAGKTIPFMLPQLYDTEKITIIISPLNVLELDQVCNSSQFSAWIYNWIV
jgi:superfamily II DNA/RNA helicase